MPLKIQTFEPNGTPYFQSMIQFIFKWEVAEFYCLIQFLILTLMQFVYRFCQTRFPGNQLSSAKSAYKIIMYYGRLKILFHNRNLLLIKQNLVIKIILM